MSMNILLIVFSLVVFIYSVVIHEVSHGLAADAMGDNTARVMGRLTLNPIKHLDLFGSLSSNSFAPHPGQSVCLWLCQARAVQSK